MDKGSNVTPAAHGDQERIRREPLATAVTLPNPYKSLPTLQGNQSLLGYSKTAADNSSLGRHGYSKPTRVTTIQHKTSTIVDPLTKAPMGNPKSPGHGRKEMKGRGRVMAESVSFEVKMDEFPELSGIFVDQVAPHFPRNCWGTPQSFEENTDTAWKGNKHAPISNYKPPQSDLSPNSPGKAKDPKNVSVTSSWANIASQPPKKTAQIDEVVEQTDGENMGKKKRKKKRKKPKGAAEEMETVSDNDILCQDPPKFEDEEEFPGLKPFTGSERLLTRSKTTHLSNDENQRMGIQQHAMDQNKDKSKSAKSLNLDPTKVQVQYATHTEEDESMPLVHVKKAEKVSGKKSKVPVQLDIGNMLAVLEKKQSQKTKQDTKPLTLSVGGGLPLVPKQHPVQKKPVLLDKMAHNPLDSTSPLVKKGKQREVPKAKKPTALKKVIMKEREERKQKRLVEERGEPPECESIHAEEENCETSDAEEVGSPAEELVNQIENDEQKVEEPSPELTTSPLTIPHLETPKIHSRKFREYCTQMLSKDVDEGVTALLKELVRFQDRLYQKDPMKARMKRRIVMGLREVLKHLKLRKVKCVIISPNCERSKAKGGLDEALHTIIDICREQEVPFIFALSRKALGRCVNKAVPVSLVGIFNYDGAQDIFHKMIELSSEARKAYEAMLLSLEQMESEASADTEQIQSAPQDSEEPEYIKVWKKLLENESNHSFVNLEEQLNSMCLDSDNDKS